LKFEEEPGDEASWEMNADEAETLIGSIDDCGCSGNVEEGACMRFDSDTGGRTECTNISESSELGE
jgi:hypothetical protein